MSDAKVIQRARKRYVKPQLTARSRVEIAALLREELSVSQATNGAGSPRGLVPGLTLLFEGYKGDVGQIRQTLESNGLCARPDSCENGDGPLEIRFSAQDISPDLPSVFLLDFRLHSQTSRRLLEEISRNPNLQRLPIAILVDSAQESLAWIQCDSKKCRRLTGPLNSSDVARALKSLLDLWRLSHEMVLPENGSRRRFPAPPERRRRLTGTAEHPLENQTGEGPENRSGVIINVSDQSVSLRDFLEERHLVRKDSSHLVAETRSRLEQSKLLEMVDGTCAALNREAGTGVIEAHAYLPPEAVVRSFLFMKGPTEYVMRLDLWGTKPTLVFLVRRWRDNSSIRLVRWIYRLAELDPLAVETKFVGEIQEETVSEQEVQRWFFYLLSGMSRSYMPTVKRLKGFCYAESER